MDMKTAEIVKLNPEPDFDYLWKIAKPGRKGSKAISASKFADIISSTGLATTMKDPTTGHMITVTWRAAPDEVIMGYKAFLQHHIMHTATEDEKYIKTLPFWLNGGCWEDQDLELAERWDRVHGGRYEQD